MSKDIRKNRKLKNCIENELRQELTEKIMKDYKEQINSNQKKLIEALNLSNEALAKTVTLQEKQIRIYERQLECSAKLFEEIYPDKDFSEETIDEQSQKFINEASKFIDEEDKKMKQFDNVMGALLKNNNPERERGRPKKLNNNPKT